MDETLSFRVESSTAEGVRTLAVRCPHCWQRVNACPQGSLLRIVCSACGATFGLADSSPQQLPDPIGNFEFLELLGVGGFGTVWKARDQDLQRDVAIKLPRQGKLAPLDMERFMDEARVAARLHHPGIVHVHEVGRDGDRVYIVSDLVRGQPLTRKTESGGVPWREAVQLCIQIADALAHAHRQGFVHRDLKPHNILLDAEDRPRITDFGLAKHTAVDVTVTADGHILGTPAYMSPEQAAGRTRDTDERSDVYSLGVILYELLTGERPFRGDLTTLLQKVTQEPPPRPRSIRSTIPNDVEVICLKCLEKDRDGRYRDANELADDLKRVLAGEPIRARPVGWFEQCRRWCWRNPLLAGLVATTLIMSLCTVAGALSIARLRQADIEMAIQELSQYRRERPEEIRSIERLVASSAEQIRQMDLRQVGPFAVQDFLREQYDRHRNASDLPAHGVLSWFWQDATGKLLAIHPMDQVVLGRDLHARDYFQGALRVGPDESYVSEPFHSLNDGLYKFAISRLIADDQGSVGVLSVSVATEASHSIQRQERLVRLLQIWATITLLPLLLFLGMAVALAIAARKRTTDTDPSPRTTGSN